MLVLMLVLMLLRGGCRGERVHIWPKVSIAGIWRVERGISLARESMRSGTIAHRVSVGTHLVQCGLRHRRDVLSGVMPTFTLIMGNGRMLGECGKRSIVICGGEGRVLFWVYHASGAVSRASACPGDIRLKVVFCGRVAMFGKGYVLVLITRLRVVHGI